MADGESTARWLIGLVVAGGIALAIPFIDHALDEKSEGDGAASPTTPTSSRTSGPAPTPPASKPADPSVVWEGEVIFGEYSFDFVPPRASNSLQSFDFIDSRFYTADETGRLAAWPNATAPTRAQCIAEVRKNGNFETDKIPENTYVCGSSHKGIPFRIHVIGSKDGLFAEAVTDVTIWRK